MQLAAPFALLLLLLLPLFLILGWPKHGFGFRRELISLVTRLVIVLCLIFSLAGVALASSSHNLAVVFLIDVSDSMPADAVSSEVNFVRQALKSMKPDDQAAVVVFGGDALVERAMSNSQEFPDISSVPRTNQTDIGGAIRLALALYPPGYARRMVILSDGEDNAANQPGSSNIGDALPEAARLAAASGVEIIVVPFQIQAGTEVLLKDLQAPAHLRQGEKFDLHLTIQSSQPVRAGVRVLAGDKPVYEGAYDLRSGTQSFSLPLVADTPGFQRYTVQILPQNDHYYQNNEMSAYSLVEGPPKVLLVAPEAGEPIGYSGEKRPDELTPLVNALKSANIQIETAAPGGLPADLTILENYSSIILVDVPARDLTQRQMLAVQSYVRDLGGGFVVVGGPTSYGVGGYFRTPLEETLPVEMQIKDQKRRPTLAIVFIIDHSGSMAETSGGAAKVELAKEAAIRSIQLLSPTDRVGVIAFDETASWVVPMTDLSDPDRVISAIGSIRASGGTNILAGVQAMANALPQDPAQVKHVILLTDGGADPAGIPELVQKLHQQDGITLSTVGVGTDAAPYLKQLADIGAGRYHFTADPGSIPSIFTEETTLATRAYIVEEPFFPKLSGSSPILDNIQQIPRLYGYVGTSTKPAAQTILASQKDDPILAAWQYGLGKSVAFTSDATGRWAKDWVGWNGFPTFWAQAVRYTMSEPSQYPLELQVSLQGENAHLSVDAFQRPEPGASGNSLLYLDNYALKAKVLAPDGQAKDVPLNQTAPGHYEGDFLPLDQGAYLIQVTGQPNNLDSSPNTGIVEATSGWVLSYSPEYQDIGSDPGKLVQVAQVSGGIVGNGDPSQVFEHTLVSQKAPQPIWPWLLALAAILLPFDIGVRRLVVTRSEFQQYLGKMGSWVNILFGIGEKPHVPERSPQMDSLLRLKERLRPDQDSQKPATEKLTVPSNPGTIQKPAEKEPRPEAEKIGGRQETDNTSSSQPSTASTLLARKRSRQASRSDDRSKDA